MDRFGFHLKVAGFLDFEVGELWTYVQVLAN